MADTFNQECLEKHNEFRSKHGCPALAFSAPLATAAQKWAEELARLGRLEHSADSKGQVGENVAMKWVEGGTEFTGQQATCQWYSEIKDYDFGGENQINCGHFSQVVWRASQEAGFGRAEEEKTGKVFVVGQYRPAGNFRDKWTENIPKPLSGEIEVPSEEDVMGPRTHLCAMPAQRAELKSEIGGAGPEDILIGKNTRTKTSKGVKTVIVTETYQRADGSTYTLNQEVTEQVA